jgi:hypothetical protein
MTAEDREQLRLSLLRFCAENRTRFGSSSGLLHQRARNEGRSELTKDEVEAELDYLAEKGLIANAVKMISPEMRAWKITPEGRDYLAVMGVA